MPRVINIDKSGSNTVAIKVYNKRSLSKLKTRQSKYLNNNGDGATWEKLHQH